MLTTLEFEAATLSSGMSKYSCATSAAVTEPVLAILAVTVPTLSNRLARPPTITESLSVF